ncbi:TPR repeat-containing protein DDB_G0287407-like isoform X2 [Branchiostoma floridae x Branchiostoma japonicum]
MGCSTSKSTVVTSTISPHPDTDNGKQEPEATPKTKQDNRNQTPAHHGCTSAHTRKDGEKNLDPETTVKECWKEIDKQCWTCTKAEGKDTSRALGGWQVVRVFVSSTFTDFHMEREALVKKVFPELREWCEGRQLHLVECDLRWGVPKDSTSQTTISICLEELDRCLKETDGQPFFLAMLGERYGWIPSIQDVSEEIREKYSWVDHLSITHMEIVRGAVRSDNPSAAFFLRDPDFLKDLPQDQLANFVDTLELNTQQQKELKSRLKARFPDQVFDYTCSYDGEAGDKVQLLGLEEFCKRAVKFLKTAIGNRYPESRGELPSDSQAILPHIAFIEEKGRFLTGRDAEIQKVLDFATSDITKAPQMSEEPADHTMLVVLGDSGTGKSFFMSKCATELRQKTDNFLYHFVGCCPESIDPVNILQRLCGHMANQVPEEAVEGISSMSYVQLQNLFHLLLEKTSNREDRLVVLIDGLNQVSDHGSPTYLEWLPTTFPSNLRFIISTTSDPATLQRLRGRQSPPHELKLHVLGQEARQNIVKTYFKQYNKILDDEQLDLLTSSAGAGNPVWLAMACEELRVFGDFSRLTEKIDSLPASLEGLMNMLISRIVTEDETGYIAQMLCLIECSQHGLQESELQMLLGDPQMATPLPALTWGQVLRTLKPFLRNTAGHQNLPLLGFFHESVSKVVQKSLLGTQTVQQSYHKRLADYYKDQCANQQLVVTNLPYHLQEAGLEDRLADFLKNNRGITEKHR